MKNVVHITIVWIVFSQCPKDISVDGTLNHSPKLFIECILYPGIMPKVYLSNSVSFFNKRFKPSDIFVRNANINIVSEDRIDHLTIDSTFDHFRVRWVPHYQGNHSITYDATYQLQMEYQGVNYQATITLDLPKANISKVASVEFFDVYGGHDGVIITFKDAPGFGNVYRFQMDRWIDKTRWHVHVLGAVTSDCTQEGELFQVTDLGRIVFNDIALDGQNMEFNAEVLFEYLEGDTGTIYLQSLDAKSAQFFQDLDNQLQSILNPFVEPTFIHSTNEGAFGVFGSVVQSDPVTFVYPQDNP